MNFTETDIKYIAGLLDADGWISLIPSKSSSGKIYVQLQIGLGLSNNIDRDGQVAKWLAQHCGTVSTYNYADTFMWSWGVRKRADLNKLVPRLLKHMLIKGGHLSRLYAVYSALEGLDISEEEADRLREWSKASRKNSGPAKPNNYPTKAWTAGYLDGDGCYTLSTRKRDGYKNLKVDAFADAPDAQVLDLLVKTYGGSIRKQENGFRWSMNLGATRSEFAQWFLKQMHRHSRLKKHKIEQLLAFHNNRPQRLTKELSTEKVIV